MKGTFRLKWVKKKENIFIDFKISSDLNSNMLLDMINIEWGNHYPKHIAKI